jgi:large conductance mechanosensitive channel
MKNFMKEFKEFISRGDVMSMAVGIIIGGAFTAIVSSLVGDIITPIIGIVTGGIDFTGLSFKVGSAEIMIGNFIQAVITFLLTAFVIFVLMKGFNKLVKKKEASEEAAPAEPSAEVKLLTEIRDLLKEQI